MSGKTPIPRPAYVVDFDEDSGRAVRGTVRSASTRKERPVISQRDVRSGKPRKSLSDSATTLPDDSSDEKPVEKPEKPVAQKEGKKSRRMSMTAATTRSPRKEKEPERSSRPPKSYETRPFPSLAIPHRSRRDDPAHYGIATPSRAAPPVVSQPIPIRPTVTTSQTYNGRPQSYHAGSYTSSGYNQPHPLSTSPFYPPSAVLGPQYPAPPSSAGGFRAYTATPPQDYFNPVPPVPRSLSSRFDPIIRSTSAYSSRDSLVGPPNDNSSVFDGGYHDDDYASTVDEPMPAQKRASIRVSSKSNIEKEYDGMPPPPLPRPSLRRPVTSAATPQAIEYIDDPNYSRESLRLAYRDDSRPRRPSANRNSVSYDLGRDAEKVRVVTANSSRRRASYLERPPSKPASTSTSTTSSGYEDKLRDATLYQDDIGGATVPLTAEVLRKQRRETGSSRSTKSSGSRDESEYRKSVTTRTTRSGSGNDDENVTIKVSGQARVMVGGAEIECREGGQIQIHRRQSINGGSERAPSEYSVPRIEDRRSSRGERSSGRSRISSVSRISYPSRPPSGPPEYPLGAYI